MSLRIHAKTHIKASFFNDLLELFKENQNVSDLNYYEELGKKTENLIQNYKTQIADY